MKHDPGRATRRLAGPVCLMMVLALATGPTGDVTAATFNSTACAGNTSAENDVGQPVVFPCTQWELHNWNGVALVGPYPPAPPPVAGINFPGPGDTANVDDPIVLRADYETFDSLGNPSRDRQVATLNLSGSQLSIQQLSSLTITGPSSTWTGGILGESLNASGSFIVAPGATLTVSGNAERQLRTQRSVVNPAGGFFNQGTVIVTDTSDLALINNVTWENGGLLDLQADGGVIHKTGVSGGAFPVFRNNSGGILRKSGGTGATSTIGVVFENTGGGKIEVQVGRLVLAQSLLTNVGTVAVGGGSPTGTSRTRSTASRARGVP